MTVRPNICTESGCTSPAVATWKKCARHAVCECTPPCGQGWDRADFRCGRCGEHIIATTEEKYIVSTTAHRLAHELLDATSPELRAKLIDLALSEFPAG